MSTVPPSWMFSNNEFEAVGATLVPQGSFKNVMDQVIVGLEELMEEDFGCTAKNNNSFKFSRYSEKADLNLILSFRLDPRLVQE